MQFLCQQAELTGVWPSLITLLSVRNDSIIRIVETVKSPLTVIPAEAGIQNILKILDSGSSSE